MTKKENMTDEEIKNGNKLIAEFMGGVLTTIEDGSTGFKFSTPVPTELNISGWKNKTFTKYLFYHTSWDWLIPVVEKIEQIPQSFVFHTHYK